MNTCVIFTRTCSIELSDDPVEYIVLTREIYSICDMENPGFCTGVRMLHTLLFKFVS